MAKVCILNSSTNVVENTCEVDDVNSVPDFLISAGQSLATDHTGNIGDTWNGTSYDAPVVADTRTDEEKWEDIRATRNTLLAESDWTQLADTQLDDSTQTVWQTYRQSLRDITTSVADPDDVVWPNKP